MDTDALKTFLTVHRAGGFARASALLHRSQPAISRRIGQLEAEIGAPLFDRDLGGAQLTEAGRTLLEPAERALAALEDCRSAMQELRSGQAGPLSVALVGTLADARFAAAARRLAQDRPGVALTLRTALSAEVSDLVRSGEAALGLRYFEDASADLDCERLFDEPLVVIAAPTHPAASLQAAPLLALRGERWLAFPAAPGSEAASTVIFAQFLTRGCAEIDWRPIDSLTAQKRLVEAGMGLALLPASAVEEEVAAGRLRIVEIADLTAANPVYLVTRRKGRLSEAAKRFAGDLATLYRSRSGT